MGAQRYSQLTGSKNQPKSHTAESSCPWDFHEASRFSEPRCRCTPLSRGCLCPALCCLGAELFSSLSSVSAGGGPRSTAPQTHGAAPPRPPRCRAPRLPPGVGHTQLDAEELAPSPGGTRAGGLQALAAAREPHRGKARGAGLSGKRSLRHVPCHLSVPHSFFKVPTTCWALVGE